MAKMCEICGGIKHDTEIVCFDCYNDWQNNNLKEEDREYLEQIIYNNL